MIKEREREKEERGCGVQTILRINYEGVRKREILGTWREMELEYLKRKRAR